MILIDFWLLNCPTWSVEGSTGYSWWYCWVSIGPIYHYILKKWRSGQVSLIPNSITALKDSATQHLRSRNVAFLTLLMLLSKTESQKCKSAHATRMRTRLRSAPTPAHMTISSNGLPFSHSGHQLRVMTSTIPSVVYYTTLILPPCLLSIVERDR